MAPRTKPVMLGGIRASCSRWGLDVMNLVHVAAMTGLPCAVTGPGNDAASRTVCPSTKTKGVGNWV